ncbi:hypothetical protein D3C74_320450 [compost metagenome]
MIQDTANVVQCHFTQVGISAFFVEQRRIAIEDGLVNVHTATIVAEQRFWHEGCHFAVLACSVLHNIFVSQEIVGCFLQGIKTEVDFRLACSRHFMVMAFDFEACFTKQTAHFTADILLGIHWRYWHVAAFNAHFECHVAAFVFAVSVPYRFFGIYEVGGAVHSALIAHIVKDKELGFRCEKCCCTYTAGLQELFCFYCDAARVALITFAIRCENVAHDVKRWMSCKRIDVYSARIRHHNHV